MGDVPVGHIPDFVAISSVAHQDLLWLQGKNEKPSNFAHQAAAADDIRVHACTEYAQRIHKMHCWCRDPLEVCRPLGVEVYKVHPEALQGWEPPMKAKYAGAHGLNAKPWA